MPLETGKILVIGDSWADKGWPEIMGIPESLRQGVSGSSAAQWAADYRGYLTRAKQTEADTVIVSLGGNDLRAAATDGRASLAEVNNGLRAMRTVLEAVQRLLTIVILYTDPYCGRNAQARIGVPALNGLIRWAGAALPIFYADLGEWLTAEHFDGVDFHPTGAGYVVIAERMQKLVGSISYAR